MRKLVGMCAAVLAVNLKTRWRNDAGENNGATAQVGIDAGARAPAQVLKFYYSRSPVEPNRLKKKVLKFTDAPTVGYKTWYENVSVEICT